jgi:hypothetical protein
MNNGRSIPADPARRLGEKQGPAMDRRSPQRLSLSCSAAIAVAVVPCAVADTESLPIPRPQSDGAMPAAATWIPVMVVAACVVAALMAWRRRSRGRTHGGCEFQVVERLAMGKGRSLSLVRAGDRLLLIGDGPQGFQRLGEFAAHHAADAHGTLRRLVG